MTQFNLRSSLGDFPTESMVVAGLKCWYGRLKKDQAGSWKYGM